MAKSSAMWIKRIVLLAIIASFPNRSDADSAPVEGVDLGVSSVTIQPIVPDAKLKRDLLPVVSSCVNPSSYARAVEGHCRGVAGVVGCLPILYPNDFLFTAASFTRTGTTLNLTLSYHPSGGTFISPSGRNLIVFAAPLPTDLPDGHYHVMCNVVRDAADGATPTTALAEAELECDLDLPDPAIARSEKDVQSLAAMGDAELLQAYETRGHALKQTQIGPMDDGIICQSAAAYEDDRYYSWQLARAAVLHRGGSMVPLMMEMLRREVPRNHDLQDGLYGFGFARDLMEMLSAIGDPRPVPLLVDVLVGFDGNANPLLRTVAAKALRHLTFISFARHEEGDEYDCVIAPTTELDAGWNVDQPWAIQRHSEAAGYRHWLANEGKNPADWLPLAQGRARTILAGDNFAEISAAIRFLQGPPAAGMGSSGHDNDPAATMTRLGQIMAEAKSQRKSPTGPATCTWKNQEIELPLEQLANFGPRARPLMPMLLRVLSEQGDTWDRLADLSQIGGETWMAELIRRLAAANSELAKSAIKPATPVPQSDAIITAQVTRWGIDRWAGRTFADDAEITAWWNANKNRTQQQWLTDGLEPTAIRADAGDVRSQTLLRILLPDLPAETDEFYWPPPPNISDPPPAKQSGKVFRVAWLHRYRSQLVYDELIGGFRLR